VRICERHDREAETPALRDDREWAWPQGLVAERTTESHVRASPHIHEADAIRADYTHAAPGDRSIELTLHVCAGSVSGLLKSGSQDYGERNSGFATLLERFRHVRRRHRDNRSIDRARHLAYIGIRFDALYLGTIGIDGIELSFIAAGKHVHERLPADRFRIGRRADDCNGRRIEQPGEVEDCVARGCCCRCCHFPGDSI
jgi:hypothetical protein